MSEVRKATGLREIAAGTQNLPTESILSVLIRRHFGLPAAQMSLEWAQIRGPLPRQVAPSIAQICHTLALLNDLGRLTQMVKFRQ